MSIKKEKKGFRIECFSDKTSEYFKVYFEIHYEGKITYCFISDSFCERSFRGKAVLHEDDAYDKQLGYKIAFERALEKRDIFYEKSIKKFNQEYLKIKNFNVNIEKRFQKLLRSF